MEILQVLRTVAFHFVETDIPPDFFITPFADGLRSRYKFFEIPSKVSEVNPAEGMTFGFGKFEDAIISKLLIYENGFSAEAPVSSDKLDRFLDDLVEWTTAEFGITYRESEPICRTYFSALEVKPQADLSSLVDRFDPVGRELASMLVAEGFPETPYHFNGLSLHGDLDSSDAQALRPAKFVFERRAGRAFDENIFYSEAPASTVNHTRLLETLESLV